MDAKLNYLALIYSQVDRFSGTCFRLKAWALASVLAIVVIALQWRSELIMFALVPAMVFWFFDAHMLRWERAFRELYNQVRVVDTEDLDFGMQPERTSSYTSALFTCPVFLLHGPLTAFALAMVVALYPWR